MFHSTQKFFGSIKHNLKKISSKVKDIRKNTSNQEQSQDTIELFGKSRLPTLYFSEGQLHSSLFDYF